MFGSSIRILGPVYAIVAEIIYKEVVIYSLLSY